ncbi:MAG: hypothetical protein RLZZ522_532 [Verrucomicrobiota bacterium]
MQLQKLVYFAHGFALALLDKPLIYSDVQAWQYGPVYPKLYKKLRKYGAGRVTDRLDSDDEIPEPSDCSEVIKGVWKAYGSMSAGQLSARTHAPNTPWSHSWAEGESTKIPDDRIKAHFKGLLVA